jgi:hypothetical protein
VNEALAHWGALAPKSNKQTNKVVIQVVIVTEAVAVLEFVLLVTP